MIDWLGINRTFVVIGIFLLIGFFMPLENIITMNKYESLKVPKFTLPVDLVAVAAGKPGSYASVNTKVFLGPEPEKVAVPIAQIKTKKKKTYPRLRLSAIMLDGDLSVAKINGALMKVGGKIYGHRILKITENGVLIDGPTGKRTLRMR